MFEESEARTKMWPQKCQLTCRSSWYSLVAPQSSLSLRSGQPAQSGDNSYTWSALWQRSQHHRPGAHKWRSSQQSHCDPEKKKKKMHKWIKTMLAWQNSNLIWLKVKEVFSPPVWACWLFSDGQSLTSEALCTHWSSAGALQGQNQRCHGPTASERKCGQIRKTKKKQ